MKDLQLSTQISDFSDPQVVTIGTQGSGRLRVVLQGHGVLFDGEVGARRAQK